VRQPSLGGQVVDQARLIDNLVAAGVGPGDPVALVVVPGTGVGVAATPDGSGQWGVVGDPAQVVAEVAARLRPRWTWWHARTAAGPLLSSDLRLTTCWDLAAVHRVLHGGHRDDPAVVWAACHDLPEPPRRPARREVTLLDFAADDDPAGPTGAGAGAGAGAASGPPIGSAIGSGGTGPSGAAVGIGQGVVRSDGQLHRSWADRDWASGGDSPTEAADLFAAAPTWAGLALAAQLRQEQALRALPDPRAAPRALPLSVLTAYAESAAALLALELEHDGLPIDRSAAEAMIAGFVGPRPVDEQEAIAIRERRDAAVLRHFPAGVRCDLRNPAQVRDLLTRVGFTYPDTRSWRLEPFRSTHRGVAALLDWRKAERIATTYGYGWLDRHVGTDGRLRGEWGAADAAAGRMTASAGLHNLPAGLRVAVVAEPGHVLVRADLGQVEPRVLAAVSGDAALAGAARADDMYAPVAAELHCDRPTAKVAVLAAMYGQTSGAAGEALKRMEVAYPDAIGYLRAAEQAGNNRQDVRTFGGRLIRLSMPDAAESQAEKSDDTSVHDVGPGQGSHAVTGHGRFARNAVVQGAAAELFKAWAATVRIGLLPLGGQIVLCLHDELLVHVAAEQAAEAADLLGRALDSTAAMWAAGSGVRFVADITCVHRWSDAKG
jgi:DNA polymerase I